MFNLDFSVHAFSGGDHRLPLYDRQQRFDQKISKLKNIVETKTPTVHLGCP